MKDAVKWVREALTAKSVATHLSYYLIRDGMIYATDGRMVAAHPFPFEGPPFLVRGADFERVLFACLSEPVLTLSADGGTLHLKAGKLKSKFSTLDHSIWPYDAGYTGQWEDIPVGMIGAMRDLRPFISDDANQAWATCMGLRPGFAYATNNVAVVRAKFDHEYTTLVPCWVIDFLLPRSQDITAWAIQEATIWFRWNNGAWLKSVSVHGEFPARAKDLIEGATVAPFTHEPDAEWRTSYDRVMALSTSDLITFTRETIRGQSEGSITEEDAETPLPDGLDEILFTKKYFDPVAASVVAWSPTVWPNPVPFAGRNTLGVVAARRA